MSELKPGWRRLQFNEMVTSAGATRKARGWSAAAAGVERYVSLEHLDPNSPTIRRWGSPEDVGENSDLRPFEAGDVILARRGIEQRKVGFATFNGVASGHALVFRARPGVVLPEFLAYFLLSDAFMACVEQFSAGSLSKTVNLSSLLRLDFTLPPIQVQQVVLEALKASLESIEAATELRMALKALKTSIVFNFENITSPSKMLQLSSIVERIEAGKSPKSIGKQAEECELGVLKVSAVGDWSYYQAENKVISRSDYLPCAEVRAGDLLAARANADPDSVGRTCLVQETRSGLMLSDKTWRIVLKEPAAKYSYAVLAWTKTRIFRKYIRNKLNGTDAKNISQKAFLASPFPEISREFIMLDRTMRELGQNEKEAFRRELHATALHSKALSQLLSP